MGWTSCERSFIIGQSVVKEKSLTDYHKHMEITRRLPFYVRCVIRTCTSIVESFSEDKFPPLSRTQKESVLLRTSPFDDTERGIDEPYT